MKVLVVGGMHGAEPLGIALVELLRFKPIPGVDACIANQKATEQKVRFIEQDLNRSFPGDSSSDVYEVRRAAEIMPLLPSYDVVLDFHNTYCSGNDSVFIGESARPLLDDVAEFFGLMNCVVADYDCVNKYAPNCISIEISMDSPINTAEYWYERILELVKCRMLPGAANVQKYRFVYRMTLEDRDSLGLPLKGLKAFSPISKDLAAAMGVESPAYPIFINDKMTPYNYGGLLNKIDKRDTVKIKKRKSNE